MSYNVGVVGAAGFAGIELVRLLLTHPDFSLKFAASDSLAHTPLSQAYPAFRGVTDMEFVANEEADFSACDAVFLAVPHTAALSIAPDLIDQGITVIDLSADFRLKDPAIYQQWYGVEHTAPDLLAKSFFGLPEVAADEIAAAAASHVLGNAVLVACAGCYPTASALAAAPAIEAGLVDAGSPVIIDAISGVTGAGKTPSQRTHFCFANENAEAYGLVTHRHTPEIEQILGLQGRLVFTPHLAPLNRGLLSTVNLPLSCDVPVPSNDELAEIYEDFYASSPLVSVCHEPDLPQTSSVAGTNRAHVSAVIHESAAVIIAIGAIDNLGKGAAGQAIQCANAVFGLSEETGLDHTALPV